MQEPPPASNNPDDAQNKSSAKVEAGPKRPAWLSFLRNGARWLAAELGINRPLQPSRVVTTANTGILAPLLTAGLLMLVFVTIPPPPMSLNIDVDSSLSGVLNYAHQHGLQ